jgi:DNA-binding transcriptional MocR family regulator
MVAHKNIIEQACMVRQNMDIHPNNISQWLINEFIKSGQYEDHIHYIKKEYKEKCDHMHNVLLRHAPETMVWSKPIGGYYIWCQLPKEVHASELLLLCIKEGVAFMPGLPFFVFEKGENYIRLNFTTPTVEQIQTGIPIICSNIKKLIDKEMKENNISASNYLPIY